MKVAALIFGFISEAWSLLFKIALVIVAIVVVVGFIRGCATNATLSEHSSCQQFAQADTTTQNNVLQDMMTAHHSQGGVALERDSVILYCQLHDSSSPIDGIYNSSNVEQPAQALHTAYFHDRHSW